ncbi:probable ATP-dependent RNA helicase DDX28 [Belonocnema kinseyi]|uniref:probable ATP-dependent RNA helicase DDX28 n=1 Tax=Belonocnema kinseyi TaxID=2817044 RepID=UPI00143D3A88|nr:probable ATP-dependent RNA helicase DDX28 [Belonocnema kinseyi]
MLPRLCNICQRNFNPSRVILRKYSAQLSHSSVEEISEEEFERKLKNPEKKKVPIITCKRSEFNFYKGQTYPKFQEIPLASKGWMHKEARGDYFTIHPPEENIEDGMPNDVTFHDLGIHQDLIDNLKNHFRIETPTTIQQKGIPKILNYQNTKLAAETGCGKTLAYLLPLVSQVLNWKMAVNRKFNHPLALIITPSRELAIQIGKEANKLTRNLNVRTKVVVGGGIRKKVNNPSVSDVDIIVATLGGLSKLTTLGIYNMNFVRHVILDEADSLFDETFYDKLRHFLRKISFGPLAQFKNNFPKFAQLTLVSATMPQHLEEILQDIVDPSSLEEVTTNKLHRIYVPQKFLRLGPQQKPMALLKLIKKKAANKCPIIIFSNDSVTCDYVSMLLHEFNVRNIHLNGQMSIFRRKGKFEEFQTGRYNVLCTTDAGSRGLDTIIARDVINYDFPLQTVEYIHRCGRTARVGSPKDCRVVNFVAHPLEIILTQKIEKATRSMKPLPMLDYLKRNWVPEEEEEARSRPDNLSDYSEKDLKSIIEEPDIQEMVEVNEK